MLDYLQRIKSYVPKKSSSNTFVNRILNNKCASIIENAKAQKRGSGMGELSLDSWLENTDGENDELPDPASENSYIQDLRIDLKKAAQNMEPKLLTLMNNLRTHSMSEIARIIGTPRGTLHESLNALRDELTGYGIKEYLH